MKLIFFCRSLLSNSLTINVISSCRLAGSFLLNGIEKSYLKLQTTVRTENKVPPLIELSTR